MKKELVKFNNGLYGVRRTHRGWFMTPKYMDFKAPGFWWAITDPNMHDCMTTLEEAEKAGDSMLKQ